LKKFKEHLQLFLRTASGAALKEPIKVYRIRNLSQFVLNVYPVSHLYTHFFKLKKTKKEIVCLKLLSQNIIVFVLPP
jgi:hypothetical protein